MSNGGVPLLEAKDLVKEYEGKNGTVRALSGVSLSLMPGETVGLVGESGCGKSTLGRCLLRLIEPTRGEVLFRGKNILGIPSEELRTLRQKIQIIFQDPFAALNPRFRVEELLVEPQMIHRIALNLRGARERAAALIDLVGLPKDSLHRFPHEFSGGQRQRICIARALALNPELIVCDEPVSALDVSIQAQIINLLKDLQAEFGLTYLFISHDLRVVEQVSDRVMVMYLGKVVEEAQAKDLYRAPQHPYARALLSAVPTFSYGLQGPPRGERMPLMGEPPSPFDPPSGCSFHPRCAKAVSVCAVKNQTLLNVKEHTNHRVACDQV